VTFITNTNRQHLPLYRLNCNHADRTSVMRQV